MDADTAAQRRAVGELLVLTVTEKQKNRLPGLQQLAGGGAKHISRSH